MPDLVDVLLYGQEQPAEPAGVGGDEVEVAQAFQHLAFGVRPLDAGAALGVPHRLLVERLAEQGPQCFGRHTGAHAVSPGRSVAVASQAYFPDAPIGRWAACPVPHGRPVRTVSRSASAVARSAGSDRPSKVV